MEDETNKWALSDCAINIIKGIMLFTCPVPLHVELDSVCICSSGL